MQSYFGMIISTAWPRSSSSRLSPNTTPPSPPACATGAHAVATITTNTAVSPCLSRLVPQPAGRCQDRRDHGELVRGSGASKTRGRPGQGCPIPPHDQNNRVGGGQQHQRRLLGEDGLGQLSAG